METSAHDSGRFRLEFAFAQFLEEFGEAHPWIVVPSVKWVLPSAPDGFVVPDLMLFPTGCDTYLDEVVNGWHDGLFPAHLVPTAIIEVVEQKSLETDFYLKPEWYREAGVQEYCIYDPSEEVMRPYFQGWRLRDGVYRRMLSTSKGEWFSVLGFSVSVLFHDPIVLRIGPAELEEELSDCEWLLDEATKRVGREQRKLDALTARAESLRNRLAERRS